MSVPTFSIVIANFNYGHFLEDAIQSVLKQSCRDFELIVVDGGSTDNSVDIIMKYQACLAWWCSEKDRGQSHAFNKGFSHAKGLFLTWLNADDLLMPGTLAVAKKKLEQNPDSKWLTGNFFRFDTMGRVLECKWGPWNMPRIFQGFRAPIAVFGPTSFFRKDLLSEVGGFDESFRYTMDTDLWVRFISDGVSYLRLNHYCWGFRMHAASKTAEYEANRMVSIHQKEIHEEADRCCQKNGYRRSFVKSVAQIVWRLISGSEIKSRYMNFRWRGRSVGEFVSAMCQD